MQRTTLILSCAFLLTACGAEREQGPIKIGFIGPLTGDAATYGIDSLNGIKLAVKEINERGGIQGREVEIVAEDGRCTGTDAVSAVQKLVSIDNVIAILGGQCSGETLAAAPIAEAAGIPMISSLSSSPDVTDAGDFIFRVYPSDALKTETMAQYFIENGFKKVASITENTDFAVAFHDSLEASTPEDTLVFSEFVEPGTKDYRSLITRLHTVDFDIFFPNGQTAATIASMIQQFREQGFTQPIISHDVAQDVSLLTLVPEASEGMRAIGVPEIGADSAFGISFVSQFGTPQGAFLFTALAYDAMNILAEAISESGTEGTNIRDYLYEVDSYEGVVGTLGFDKNGDVTGIPYVLYEVQDGTWVSIDNIEVD